MSDITASPSQPLPEHSRPPARKKRRWPWVLLVVIVVLALLAAGAELLARTIVPGIVRNAVVSSMELPADQQMDVETSGLLLPQLVNGRFDSLRLSSEQVEFKGLAGAVDVTAAGVPFRGGEISDAHGTITLDTEQFSAIVDRTGLPIEKVTLHAPNVTASATASLFGNDVPIDVTMKPGAEEGELLLTPVSLAAGDAEISVDELRELLGGVGDIGDLITGTQHICIADRLPAGLSLEGLQVAGDDVVADIDIDGRIGIDATLQQNGTC